MPDQDPNIDPLQRMGLGLSEGDLVEEINGDLAPSRINVRIRALKELIENRKEEKKGSYQRDFAAYLQGISSQVEASRTSRPLIFHAIFQEAICSNRSNYFEWAKAFLYVASVSPKCDDAIQLALADFSGGDFKEADEKKEQIPNLHNQLLVSLLGEFDQKNRHYLLKSNSPYHALYLQAKDQTGMPDSDSFEDAVNATIEDQPILSALSDEAGKNSEVFNHILSIAIDNLLSDDQPSETVANVDLVAASLLTILGEVLTYTDKLRDGIIWAAKFNPAGKFHEALAEAVKVLLWYSLDEDEQLPDWLQDMDCFLELTLDLASGSEEDFARSMHFASRILPCQVSIMESFKGGDFEERLEFLSNWVNFAKRGANASDAIVQLKVCDKTVELAFDSTTKERELAKQLTDVLLENCVRELGEVCSLQLDLLRVTEFSRWDEVIKPIENALKEAREKKQNEREVTIVHACFIQIADMLQYEDLVPDQAEKIANLITYAIEIQGGAIDTLHREAFKTCADQFEALSSMGEGYGSEEQRELFKKVADKAGHLAETLMIPDREWQEVLLCGNPELIGAHRLLEYEAGQAVFFCPEPWKLPSSTAAYALLESLFGIEEPLIGITPHDSLDSFVERLVELGQDGWDGARKAKYVMLYNLSDLMIERGSLREEIYKILGKPLGLNQEQIIIPEAENIDSIDQRIASLGGLDIVVMNIEEDGELCMHSIRSFEDGKAHSNDYLIKVSSDDEGQLRKGYLVGANTILSSKRVLAVASRLTQVAALKSSFFTQKTRMMPLSNLQDHKDVMVILPAYVSDKLPW